MEKQGNGGTGEKPVKEVVLSNPTVEDETSPELVCSREIIHGEVNMEALIYTEDVIRAGGFGATDTINSFLPVASDSTDFEASLRDARGYEEEQQEIHRHGLGWNDPKKGK